VGPSFARPRGVARSGVRAASTFGRWAGGAAQFPLSVHSSGRYLVQADGTPFLIHGDTPWSLAAQLTNAEIDTYLNDRQTKGFTAILLNAIEHNFTSQSPAYRNVDGVDPFTSMTDFASTLTAYWNRVDYIVNGAKSRGMVVVMNPAYLGFNGGSEGWMSEVTAESAGDLQTYGVRLAQRYTQGNVIWCLGGDYAGDSTERNKQWNIVTGIRSVRTTDIITAHGAPGDSPYDSWNGYTGWNLNNAYPSNGDVPAECATEYGRAGPLPFVMLEGRYEGEPDPVVGLGRIRLQAYTALLSGACGHFYGNNPIWHFESPWALYSYSGTWETNLDSTGAQQMAHVKTLFAAFEWWKLQPQTGSTLVSSSLSSGDSRICPALASDGSFALVWVPSSQSVTVVMSALTPSSVRVRLYDPTTGAYSSFGTFANTGTQSVATGGERVIVLDAA
jgi:hypothetical protein